MINETVSIITIPGPAATSAATFPVPCQSTFLDAVAGGLPCDDLPVQNLDAADAPIPGINLNDYLTTCTQRLSNAAFGDTVARLCQYGSSRLPKFLLPSVSDAARAWRASRRAGAHDRLLEPLLRCCRQLPDRAFELAEQSVDACAPRSLERSHRLPRYFGGLCPGSLFAHAFGRQPDDLWSGDPREPCSTAPRSPGSPFPYPGRTRHGGMKSDRAARAIGRGSRKLSRAPAARRPWPRGAPVPAVSGGGAQSTGARNVPRTFSAAAPASSRPEFGAPAGQRSSGLYLMLSGCAADDPSRRFRSSA